jgi:hypothetical protein
MELGWMMRSGFDGLWTVERVEDAVVTMRNVPVRLTIAFIAEWSECHFTFGTSYVCEVMETE